MPDPRNIYDVTLSELYDWIIEQDLKPYALTQIIDWLYVKRVTSIDMMTNLSKVARQKLTDDFECRLPEVVAAHQSTDGSVKLGLKLDDEQVIESVIMPAENRVTLCVSSQVGCAMGCTFCKTAEMKLKRNLTQGEILGQVLVALQQNEKITNIVFMGMGEPLHNFDHVVSAIQILLDDRAFNFSRRKITVSTVGLADKIIPFGEIVECRLAVSLNAPNDQLRQEIMPINQRHDLAELLAACRDYAKLRRDGVVTFEYVLLADQNDSKEHAAELVRLIAHTPCKINLIPYNGYPGSPYKRPTTERMMAFHKYLADRNFQVNIRYSKGLDVLAACGQLAS